MQVSYRLAAACLATVIAIGVAFGASANHSPAAVAAPGTPGQLVSMDPRPGGGFTMKYRSTGVDGSVVEESAVVWFPPGPRSGATVAWAHQTVGIADVCAPSIKDDVSVPGLDDLLAAGDVVVAPDYEGLGTAGDHPYLVGNSEGRSVLDAVRAARAAAAVQGPSAVFGWSQGGHAALFAGKLAPTYAPDVQLVGVAAIAPVTSVTALVDGQSPLARVPGVVSMVATGYLAAYPELDAGEVLADPATQLAAARSVCDTATALASTATRSPGPTWTARLEENDPSATAIDVPVLLAQGDDDYLLPVGAAIRAGERLCAKGSVVQMLRYPRVGHDSVPAASKDDVLTWLGDQLSGRPARACGMWTKNRGTSA